MKFFFAFFKKDEGYSVLMSIMVSALLLAAVPAVLFATRYTQTSSLTKSNSNLSEYLARLAFQQALHDVYADSAVPSTWSSSSFPMAIGQSELPALMSSISKIQQIVPAFNGSQTGYYEIFSLPSHQGPFVYDFEAKGIYPYNNTSSASLSNANEQQTSTIPFELIFSLIQPAMLNTSSLTPSNDLQTAYETVVQNKHFASSVSSALQNVFQSNQSDTAEGSVVITNTTNQTQLLPNANYASITLNGVSETVNGNLITNSLTLENGAVLHVLGNLIVNGNVVVDSGIPSNPVISSGNPTGNENAGNGNSGCSSGTLNNGENCINSNQGDSGSSDHDGWWGWNWSWGWNDGDGSNWKWGSSSSGSSQSWPWNDDQSQQNADSFHFSDGNLSLVPLQNTSYHASQRVIQIHPIDEEETSFDNDLSADCTSGGWGWISSFFNQAWRDWEQFLNWIGWGNGFSSSHQNIGHVGCSPQSGQASGNSGSSGGTSPTGNGTTGSGGNNSIIPNQPVAPSGNLQTMLTVTAPSSSNSNTSSSGLTDIGGSLFLNGDAVAAFTNGGQIGNTLTINGSGETIGTAYLTFGGTFNVAEGVSVQNSSNIQPIQQGLQVTIQMK